MSIFSAKASRRDVGRSMSRRTFILFGAQLSVVGLLGWRMHQLQVVDSEKFSTLADENRINIRLIPPARGEIFDRDGRPLAVNRQNYRVVMVREQAGDPDAVLDQLEGMIEITPRQRRRALKEMKSKSAFVPVAVAEHLSWREFAQINANSPALPGVAPEVGLTRLYPERDMLAHIVGYVSPVSEKDLKGEEGGNPLLEVPDFRIGRAGIERGAEKTLRGEAGASRIEVNAVGRVIRELDRRDGAAGGDIGMTIDLELQKYTMRRVAGESAAAVVMDVTNGDIVSMASAPGFDPNSFVLGMSHEEWNGLVNDEHRPLADKAVAGLYPPGSTFKMLVALAALDQGVITPGETVFCNGRYKLGDRYFHCWSRGGHGKTNMRNAIKRSCDVYFYEIAKRVGVEQIAAVARKFGIGQHLDINLPNVKSGLMPTKAWKQARYDESWLIGDTLNTGIGQGFVLASPLQLAVMTARLAAGGKEVKPRLIRTVNGQPVPLDPAPDLGFRANHLRMVLDGMFAVCNEKRGTAYRARIAEKVNTMAGKTGTAQVRRISVAERAKRVLKNEELPWKYRDHALFTAFAPYDNPRYAISVVVEHGGGGSKVAAPIARDIMIRALYGGDVPLTAYPEAARDEARKRMEADAEAERTRAAGVGEPT